MVYSLTGLVKTKIPLLIIKIAHSNVPPPVTPEYSGVTGGFGG
jgi:hypothetical protein